MNLAIALISSLSLVYFIGISLGIGKFREDVKQHDAKVVLEKE